MGGPNLEVFKFALYLFVPIASLIYFGDPDFYRTHALPVRVHLRKMHDHIDDLGYSLTV